MIDFFGEKNQRNENSMDEERERTEIGRHRRRDNVCLGGGEDG